MKIQEAKEMVVILLKSTEPERSKILSDFQKFICNYKPSESEQTLHDILYELAWDLDFYEPNLEWRKEADLDGEEKLIENIQEALAAIKALEIKNEQKDKH